MTAPPPDRRFQEVARWIEEQIHTGALRPGDRLPPERKLVEQFGLSRSVVREALQALSERGLIESHVGRGTFVRLPDARHLASKFSLMACTIEEDVLEAFHGLVGVLLYRASERHTDAQRARLHALLQTPEARQDVVEEFLSVLGEAARSPLLATIAHALAAVLYARGEDRDVELGILVARVEHHLGSTELFGKNGTS